VWVKEAKKRRLDEMRQLPPGMDLDLAGRRMADQAKMLDLFDWENDIIMCSWCVGVSCIELG
jgi:hypothetical protein